MAQKTASPPVSTTETLDWLKHKYGPALTFLREAGIHLAQCDLRNGRLFLQGEIPSEELLGHMVEQISKIDPEHRDLMLELRVNPELKFLPETQLAQGLAHGADYSGGTTHVVREGDTLDSISQEFYGTPGQALVIFEANRDQLSNPNGIHPGQKLLIPAL